MGPEGCGPEERGGQNFALFFPSPATIFVPFSLSDRAAGARTRQPENSKRAHLSAPALQTVMADFGQTDFGQFFDRLWPNRLWPIFVFLCFGQIFWCCCCCVVVLLCCCAVVLLCCCCAVVLLCCCVVVLLSFCVCCRCCCCCCCCCVVLSCCGCGFGLRRTTLRRTALRRTALRRTAQNFALFLHRFVLIVSLWVSSR